MLMAACYNKKLINHMILVLEPCDFTLNYFLHQMVSIRRSLVMGFSNI